MEGVDVEKAGFSGFVNGRQFAGPVRKVSMNSFVIVAKHTV